MFLYTLLVAFITSCIWATHTVEWPMFPNGNSPAWITGVIGYLGGVVLFALGIVWIVDHWKDDK